MLIVFGLLAIVVSALLILAVLVQNSKGGGLSSTFGASGANQILGARRSSEFIEKVTWYLAGGLAVIAIISAFWTSGASQASDSLRMRQAIDDQVIINDATSLPSDATFQQAPPEEE